MLFLCFKVFIVRILDVSLGTVRTLFVVKGQKLIASIIGFFEMLIWFLIVREALQTNEENLLIAVSYALGFAVGTYIGRVLSDILIKGNIGVQVFTENYNLMNLLRNEGYPVTVIECKGYNNNIKHLLYINVTKKQERKLISYIKKHDSDAFIVENESELVENGYFIK